MKLRTLIFLSLCILSPLHGALVVDKGVFFSDAKGVMTRLRFFLEVPEGASQNNRVELEYQGRLALLDKPINEQDIVLHNSEGDLMAFNIRKAIYIYDSYLVLEKKGKIEVISHVGDNAYKLYVAKFGGVAGPSTVVTAVNGRTIDLKHVSAFDRDAPSILFSVEIEPDGGIKLIGKTQ